MRGRVLTGVLALAVVAASLSMAQPINAASDTEVPDALTLSPEDFPEAFNRANPAAGASDSLTPAADALTPAAASPGVNFAGFNPVSPTRILETRPGYPGFVSTTAIGPDSAINLQVAGLAGVPADAGAVVLNVTVTQPTTGGYVTLWPTGSPQPNTSNLNMVAGQTVANAVAVKLGGGKISIYNNAGFTDVLVDVVGWAREDGHFVGLTPSRVLDTRSTGPIGAGATRTLKVAGAGGVPATGVGTVVMNVTATNPTSASYLTVWPAGQPQPNASNLNMTAGQTVPNLVFAPVGADGSVSFFNERGTTDLLADVVGYVPSGAAYIPINPVRVMDTRTGSGYYGIPGSGTTLTKPFGKLGTRATLTLDVNLALNDPVPALTMSTVQALVFNVTAVDATATSFLTVYPYGETRPNASNVNMLAGQIVPNAVMVKAGTYNRVNIYNHEGATHVLVDLVGFVPRDNELDAVDQSTASKFHVVYVQGNDSTADPNVVIPQIRTEVGALDGWFADPAQAGRHLNFDTVGSQLEVTYFKYPQFTRAQLVNWDDDPTLTVLAQFVTDGFGSTFGRNWLIYIDGDRKPYDSVCGISLVQFATLFMGNACGDVNGGTTSYAVGNAANAAQVGLHEMLHVLGAVPKCAPHYTTLGGGHVTDPNDLMYYSAASQPKQIDIGRDDYFGSYSNGCLNLAQSPFIAP